MQIVIDIEDTAYTRLVNSGYVSFNVINVVRQGTPLPKGHGTLKDVDKIKTAFPSGEYVRTESVRATIDHEDTIIEADKGSEEKE